MVSLAHFDSSQKFPLIRMNNGMFALIISATVLLFAAVMSSAPKIKITRNEVLIASAGILTLIVIIASVAASQH